MFDVDVDEVWLPIETAVPCGMLVVELVTNVLKYAYPDGEGGAARLQMRRVEGERLRVCVEDEGVGFPPGFSGEPDGTFGWRLIRALAEQLDGEIRIEEGPGARVCLEFPVKN